MENNKNIDFSNVNQIEDKNENLSRLENNAFSIDLDNISSNTNLNLNKKRNVRLIYCGDGVIEECEEDEQEKLRLEKEAKEKEIELRRKMDLEAKNLNWLPWLGYMTKKGASKTLEACDSAGEKLAWWFGITKPKFLYEIEEFNRMKKEEEERFKDDVAEEIVVGVDTVDKAVEENEKNELEMKLFDENENSTRRKK